MIHELELVNTKLFFYWLQGSFQQKLKYILAEMSESWIACFSQKDNSQVIPHNGVQS